MKTPTTTLRVPKASSVLVTTFLITEFRNSAVAVNPLDRAWLAAVLARLPRNVLRDLRLLVRPETVLRWHRDQIARRHAKISQPQRAGRPRTVRLIRRMVLRLARESTNWGYRRIHGELLVLGVGGVASTVWEILQQAGIDPVPSAPPPPGRHSCAPRHTPSSPPISSTPRH